MPAPLIRRTLLQFGAALCLALGCLHASAQTPPPAPTTATTAEETAAATAAAATAAAETAAAETAAIELKPDIQARLRLSADAIERQQRQLGVLQQRRNALPEGKPDPELDKAIAAEQKQLDDLRQQFIELASNDFDLLRNEEPQQIDVNLQQEMLLIVYPLMREMKQLSERPRAIERLSAEIAFYQQRNDALEKGLAHLRKVIEQTTDRKLLPSLRKLETNAVEAQAEVKQKLDLLQHRYQDLRDDSPPLWSSLGQAMADFTTGMGWHFLLAAALAVATYFLALLLTKLPLRIIEKRRLESYTFIERTVHFLSRVIGTFLAAIVFLMVLYSLNEWVLLGIALIVLIGTFFGLKSMVPNYLTEIRTVLNLGSVRQNERLIYNGLPWRVADLDFYTLLHNPALSGLMRVPLTQISKLSSRPFHKDEPWFPTKVGDIVLMNDGLQGRIERQTPELVQINSGESITTYRIEKFLDARPKNLSTGFVVSTIFGIDQQHQAEALLSIEQQLDEDMRASLAEQDFAEHCVHFAVEFKSASVSSLDFSVVGVFKGEAAEHHGRIQRWMHRTALASANANGWEIPFQQVRIQTQSPAPRATMPVDEAASLATP